MRDAIQRQEAATVFLLVKKDPQVVQRLSDAQQRFLLNLAEAKNNITLTGEKEVLGQINRDYREYMLHFTEFVQLPRTDTGAALAYYRENLQPRVSTIRQACERLLDLNQTAMVSGSERVRRVASTAVWSMLVVGSGAIAAGVAFSLLLSARIIRPVRQLMEATQQVAGGDYSVQVACRSNDEFASLADHFNAMVAKLRIFDELRIGELIAEKKKTEAILETIDDGIIVVDDQQKLVSVNPAAQRAGRGRDPLGVGRVARRNPVRRVRARHPVGSRIGNSDEFRQTGPLLDGPSRGERAVLRVFDRAGPRLPTSCSAWWRYCGM